MQTQLIIGSQIFSLGLFRGSIVILGFVHASSIHSTHSFCLPSDTGDQTFEFSYPQ